jgi:hypothetical protein
MTNAAQATSPTTHCHRCGRQLTDPKRIAAGYGRTCAAKIAEAAQAAALTETAAQMAKATELVTDGGIVRITRTVYLATSSDGSVRYEVNPAAGIHGTCTCRAGQYGRRCYHILAAELLTARPAVVTVAPVALARPADPFAAFADAA